MQVRSDHRARRAAFTLIELLVVIGIIAVLIGILLPALSAARRQANATKCLATLREIGNAFALYEQAYRGAWPVAWHQQSPGGVQPPYYPVGYGDRSWMDFLAPYIVGQKTIDDAGDIRNARLAYEKFKCPNWDRKTFVSATEDPYFLGSLPPNNEPIVMLGYAMHYHPQWYDYYDPRDPFMPKNIAEGYTKALGTSAVISRGFSPPGTYVKANIWRRHGSERGVIADSDATIIYTLYYFSRNLTNYFPFLQPPTGGGSAFDDAGGGGGGNFLVDGLRHARRPASLSVIARRASTRIRGCNMLFCDGHAATVSVEDAWNAIHNPGQNHVRP